MKEAIYIIVALIAFIFGSSVYYIRPLFVPITLSELRENTSYKYLKFKVVGKLEVTEEDSRYYIYLKDWENGCSGDNFCIQSLELSEEIKAENISWIKELAEKNKPSGKGGEYLADVEITGQFVERESKMFGGTYYVIKVNKLKQISPISFVTTKEKKLR